MKKNRESLVAWLLTSGASVNCELRQEAPELSSGYQKNQPPIV